MALHLDPGNLLALTRRGDVYHASGAYEAALADYSHAIALNPQHSLAYVGRAGVYATLGDDARDGLRRLATTSAAIADYERYLELRPDAPDMERVETALAALRSRRKPDTLH